VSLSLLLLEPHQDSREMYRVFLEHEGFTVVTPASIDAARAAAPTVDAVVTETDYESWGDGLAFMQRLRANPATSGLPILVVSASVNARDIDRAHAAGCDVFLPKPCVPSAVADGVRRAIARRRFGSPRMVSAVLTSHAARRSA
jgi:two-component system chemotaxis response regulator CheY